MHTHLQQQLLMILQRLPSSIGYQIQGQRLVHTHVLSQGVTLRLFKISTFSMPTWKYINPRGRTFVLSKAVREAKWERVMKQ